MEVWSGLGTYVEVADEALEGDGDGFDFARGELGRCFLGGHGCGAVVMDGVVWVEYVK